MCHIGTAGSYQNSRSPLCVLLSRRIMTAAVWSLYVALLLVISCTSIPAHSQGLGQPSGLEQLRHVIVIYQENWSFDSLYGTFPGAEGLASPSANIPQIDNATGLPYVTLPEVDPNIPLGL